MSEINKKHYENIIIGGGITGAGIFRDLSLHNQEVLLIDKNDFTSQTSQSSSKMLHGGIRYLENFDFQLVYEALHEKIYWTKLLPHLTREVPFILPIYKESKHPKFMVKIGMFLYDFLSGFKNSPHKMLTKAEVREKVPQINQENLIGAGLYHDAIMDDAKITLEVIYDALLSVRAEAINYHEVVNVKKLKKHNEVIVKNVFTQEEFKLTCKNIIFSLGPFTDTVLKKFFPKYWTPILIPSKGSHIWVEQSKMGLSHPMVINHKDGRVIFFIPNGEKVLIGTTESETGNKVIENIKADDSELDYLLEVTNNYFPQANMKKSDILSTFSGIRPLIKDNRSGQGKGKTARTHKCYQIGKDIYVIAGGKYTTFRVMAQEVTKNILNKKNHPYSSNRTLKPLRATSVVKNVSTWKPNIEDIQKIINTEMPKTIDDLVYRRIGVHSEQEWDILFRETPYSSFIERVSAMFPSQIR